MQKYHIFLTVFMASILIYASNSFAQNGEFQEFQSVSTNGASGWQFFSIGTDHYLVVANYSNGSTHNIDSKIYQWNGSNFVEFQSIPTNGARDWEFFTIGTDHYMVVANLYNGSTYNIDSKIFQWCNYRPSIISITDVPDDQGHFVRIIWDRSGLDTIGVNLQITMYGVWRRLDEELNYDKSTKRKITEFREGEIWESVGTVPAIQSNKYLTDFC